MSQTYSRTYLQGIPMESKRAEVSRIITSFINELRDHAGQGHTTFLFDMTNMRYVAPDKNKQISKFMTTYSIPKEELVPLFQEKFPDCVVTLQEVWIETYSNTKTLKSGILIDWT